MAVTLLYFTELGKLAFQYIAISVRKKESSHSLSHLLMSFLSSFVMAALSVVKKCTQVLSVGLSWRFSPKKWFWRYMAYGRQKYLGFPHKKNSRYPHLMRHYLVQVW